jgi:hypothetical protein
MWWEQLIAGNLLLLIRYYKFKVRISIKKLNNIRILMKILDFMISHCLKI